MKFDPNLKMVLGWNLVTVWSLYFQNHCF